MSYANEGHVENYLTIDIDNSFSAQISDWAEAVDLYIDKYCGRTFSNTASEVRYYEGKGGRDLDIDNFVSLSSVEILEPNGNDTASTLTEGQGDDYVVYPYNTTPKYRLQLTNVARIGAWPTGLKRIKITGEWGEASTPKDIVFAATVLLSGIVEKGLKGGSIQSESLGDYSVTFREMDIISNDMGVKEILDKYKIYEFI